MDRIPASTAGAATLANGKPGFQDQNVAAGVDGTDVPALFMNGLQEEVMAILLAAGITPDAENWGQLLAAILVLIGQQLSASRVAPVNVRSAQGIYPGANYSGSITASFGAPVAGFVVAMCYMNVANLAEIGTSGASGFTCALKVNGVTLNTDATLLPQSHMGIAAVTAGETVTASTSVTTSGNDPQTTITYGLTAFFVPYP